MNTLSMSFVKESPVDLLFLLNKKRRTKKKDEDKDDLRSYLF